MEKESLKLCGVTVSDQKKDIVFELVYGPSSNGKFEKIPLDVLNDASSEIPKELVFTVNK
ncbi:hypothetical protein HOC80_04705 [archaeon]|jgi:hypothetical protein|nr:hypothetical protein [archaeon]MBT4417374.1 hypothetical protein [archaeon]